MSISFEGRVAIVTGAGGGIGRCYALELAKRGAKVVVNDLGGARDGTGHSDMALKVVEEIRAAGGEAISNGGSVTEYEQMQAMVEEAKAKWGRVDILINNAGILRDKSFTKMDPADFELVVKVHLIGSAFATKAVWDTMREQNYGRILMTSSSTGLYGNFGQANYGAAKWCRTPDDCINLTDIEKIINNPNETPEARAAAWKGWQETARVIRKDYQRFVEIVNTGAKEMGFADAGEVWRSGYDMTPAAFADETERLWGQVKPLYEQLHCYVRGKLNAKYGDAVVQKDGKIPSHLLGNMWAQQWSNIYPLVEPYKGVASLDVTSSLKKLLISIRARAAPRQKCTPWPKDRCLLGSRPTSKRNGSVKTSSSRLADT